MSHHAIPDAAEHGCLDMQTQHAASSMLHTTAWLATRNRAAHTD